MEQHQEESLKIYLFLKNYYSHFHRSECFACNSNPFWRPAKESIVPGEIFYSREVENWVTHTHRHTHIHTRASTHYKWCSRTWNNKRVSTRGLQALIGETQNQPAEKHAAAISNRKTIYPRVKVNIQGQAGENEGHGSVEEWAQESERSLALTLVCACLSLPSGVATATLRILWVWLLAVALRRRLTKKVTRLVMELFSYISPKSQISWTLCARSIMSLWFRENPGRTPLISKSTATLKL